MTSSESTLTQLVQRAGNLYSLPAVAVKVLELTENEKIDTQALKQEIETDPALCSKLLRVVNSSLFGLSRSVDDLNQALALLGTKPLKLLVLGFSLPQELLEAGPADELARYWRFALTKAVAARQASELLWKRPGDDAFLAALLEDIGELAMMRDLGEPYVAFLAKIEQSGGDLRGMERDSLGFDHTELSAALLEHWQLPDSLIQAVARPRNLAALSKLPTRESFLPHVVHLSDLVAQLVVRKRLSILPELMECGYTFCKLTKDQLVVLIQRLEEKVLELADVLSLQLPAGTKYDDVLRSAHEQLSQVACQAAEELLQQQFNKAPTERRILKEAQELTAAARRLASSVSAAPATSTKTKCISQRIWNNTRENLIADMDASTRARVGAVALDVSVADELVEEQRLRAELTDRLRFAVADSREQRKELSLLVADAKRMRTVDGWRDSACSGSLPPALASRSLAIDHPQAETLPLSKSSIAVILPDCDRGEAVQQAHHLLDQLNMTGDSQGLEHDNGAPSIVWNIGAATAPAPSKNFQSESLLEAAERCLYGAQSTAGGTVKSLEIYC